MKIIKNIKFYMIVINFFCIFLGFSNISKAEEKNILMEIEKISTAADLIDTKKYDEATKVLNEIKSVDLYYLKNQYLGDISYLNKNYEIAISFYNIAQIHAKDKIMYDYISKRVSYIKTAKLKKGA